MKTPITQQAAHLAELCHGQSIEAITDYITGFLRVLHAEHERKVKLLREAVDELLATHELREHRGEKITPLQSQAMKQAKTVLDTTANNG